MSKYPFSEIEPKWQKYWEESKTFRAEEEPSVPKEKRRYVLDMFPYPSAAGLHVGHPEGYTATDIYCRFLRMRGFNVLHPMGFDSFGLPAENYAIQTGTHPAATTAANIIKFRDQIKAFGFSYDWDREISTCDEDYYRWTQWIFLKMFEKGLAYEAHTPINWCTSCKTGLANEEVKEGRCERCGAEVTRKNIRQWMLRITAYAERLLSDLDGLDWPESVKQMQRNWIGKSEGADVAFPLVGADKEIVVYTTRPDTLFGATYMVLSPEHSLVAEITTDEQKQAVEAYVEMAAKKSDLERTDLAKDKTGVFTGAYAVNPVNGAEIPVWISDYVLVSYGTGSIMAVPAHDERDWEFAKKFNLPIVRTVASEKEWKERGADADWSAEPAECTAADGFTVNSGQFNGMPTRECIAKITEWLEKNGKGKRTINYRLRDWVFSRQRYWGEPIPLVHCKNCGIVPLDEKDLPLRLPEVDSYQPTGTGESPLAGIKEWVACKCPKCGADAERETNTMPQWAGSCWYYLRFIDPKNANEFAAKEKIDYWMPVSLYVGGAEHAVLHLLYARFWHKVLYDLGVVNTKEPFQRLVNQGMITSFAFQRKNKTLVAADEAEELPGGNGVFVEKSSGERLERVIAKMSKSLKNVINPDDMIREYGADSCRIYEMFMGPLEVSKPWSTQGLIGVHRFLERVWSLAEKPMTEESANSDTPLNRLLHKTIKKVTEDTDTLNFNTAISQMMIFTNELSKAASFPKEAWEALLKILSPYAPHLCEELWQRLGHAKSISAEKWPEYSEALVADSVRVIVVQVNGKVRDKFETAADAPDEELKRTALETAGAKKFMAGKSAKNVIVVRNKLVSIVV